MLAVDPPAVPAAAPAVPATLGVPAPPAMPTASRAPATLQAADLAVIVNASDPLSVAIGNYYVRQRHIPKSNVVTVQFDYDRDVLPPPEFTALKKKIDTQLPRNVQAYAITWARPYRVGCMSVTSALTLGVDPKFCSDGCHPTARNPYFNVSEKRPYDDLHVRLSMSIAATDFEKAKELIDRGVRSDGSGPGGTAYLVNTHDERRNVRSVEYALATRAAQYELHFQVHVGDAPKTASDVMFYFTGATAVAGLSGYSFLPGAVADHVTSFGGMLTDSPQMSSLRWLEAGATGSYGTVVEPCALLGKFPDVPVLLTNYLSGDTLIEAYWKSVLMPGQGIFIGEPLATPFRR